MIDKEVMQQALQEIEAAILRGEELVITNLHAAIAQPEQTANGEVTDAIVSGALFDFMGMLTSQNEKTQFSSTDDAGPAVEQIKKFAAKRGLSLENADVGGWRNRLAAIAQPEQTANKLPPLPKVGPICYASASDVMEYKPSPEVGNHLPGVRDVALWSTHQMQAYARAAIAQPEQPAPVRQPLTRKQILEILGDVFDSDDETFIGFARAVETAHGINAPKAQT